MSGSGNFRCENCGRSYDREEMMDLRAEGAAAERAKWLAWIEEERKRAKKVKPYDNLLCALLDRLRARVEGK